MWGLQRSGCGRVDPTIDPGLDGYAGHVVVDGTVEAVTGYCTRNLVARLHDLGIPVTDNLPPNGTHARAVFRDELIKSWPTLGHGLGVPE
ncbi:hypothetical protein ACFXPS_02470 [Nocardia sp. NPDC059091]|uniref:hypothetical protein n=1 Tax=unclassified Nocardia TaxID=2637762 RepID=UPI0036864828